MKRRQLLQAIAAATVVGASGARAALERAVPATGERIPAVGLGTWLTFDVSPGTARHARGEVLRAFLAGGGRMVDSSPMYGESESLIGEEYGRIGRPPGMFSATKVWTVGGLAGRRQMEKSRVLWGLPRLDLMFVHNMLDWEVHLPALKEMKAQGRVRYIGVTTSHGRRHDLLEKIMRTEPVDFVQFTYSLNDRSAEERLLPTAAERRIAVVINRPFDGGDMFQKVAPTSWGPPAKAAKPLPGWAKDIDCATWAEAFLKFIISEPAVTCAIPATTNVAHVRENLRAMSGPMPDAALRRRIAADYERA